MDKSKELKELFIEFIDKILVLLTPSPLKELITKKWTVFQNLLQSANSLPLLKEYVNTLNKPTEEVVYHMIMDYLQKSKELELKTKEAKSIETKELKFEDANKLIAAVDGKKLPNFFEFTTKNRKDRIRSSDGISSSFQVSRKNFECASWPNTGYGGWSSEKSGWNRSTLE